MVIIFTKFKAVCKQIKPIEQLSCDENPCSLNEPLYGDHVSAKSVNPSITEQGNVIMA